MGEQSYSVYEPVRAPRNPAVRAESIVFLKDGFNWVAMLLPLPWLIYHRLWLPLVGFLVAMGAVYGLAWLLGIASDGGMGLLTAGLSVAFGFLANDLRRMALERQDFRLVASIVGTSALDCERRFFEAWPALAQWPAKQGKEAGR